MAINKALAKERYLDKVISLDDDFLRKKVLKMKLKTDNPIPVKTRLTLATGSSSILSNFSFY